jgi:hypothetical protein
VKRLLSGKKKRTFMIFCDFLRVKALVQMSEAKGLPDPAASDPGLTSQPARHFDPSPGR